MAEHLTVQERVFLQRLVESGKSKQEIAELMGRHRSTIYRELSRNSRQRGYRPRQTLDWDVDFSLPDKSCQRGTNENTNGLIRDFFPKGTDFTRISHQAVARVENVLNERPRKRLGYKTPNEVHAKHLRRN